jgi:hypothetical protein
MNQFQLIQKSTTYSDYQILVQYLSGDSNIRFLPSHKCRVDGIIPTVDAGGSDYCCPHCQGPVDVLLTVGDEKSNMFINGIRLIHPQMLKDCFDLWWNKNRNKKLKLSYLDKNIAWSMATVLDPRNIKGTLPPMSKIKSQFIDLSVNAYEKYITNDVDIMFCNTLVNQKKPSIHHNILTQYLVDPTSIEFMCRSFCRQHGTIENPIRPDVLYNQRAVVPLLFHRGYMCSHCAVVASVEIRIVCIENREELTGITLLNSHQLDNEFSTWWSLCPSKIPSFCLMTPQLAWSFIAHHQDNTKQIFMKKSVQCYQEYLRHEDENYPPMNPRRLFRHQKKHAY